MNKDNIPLVFRENLPPVYDDNLEKAIIGAILINPQNLAECSDLLNEDCFYIPYLRSAFCAASSIYQGGEEVNLVSVSAEMSKGETQEERDSIPLLLADAEYTARSTTNPRPIADKLRDLANRRKLCLAFTQAAVDCSGLAKPLEAVTESATRALQEITEESAIKCSTLADGLAEVHRLVSDNMNPNRRLSGTPTGFRILDTRGGLQPGNLVIVAGASSQGKTALTLSMVRRAVADGAKVAMYSLEMMPRELNARLIAAESGVECHRILTEPLQGEELLRVDEAIGRLERVQGNVYIDARSTSNIDTILASIRTQSMKNRIDGAVVDYLQILNVNMKNTNKEQAMGDVARRLKNLAKELGIWIVALSQLNRDRDNPCPSIDRLRDSGQIAEAADVVLLVYRPSFYGTSYPKPFDEVETRGTALLDLAKGRNIGTDKTIVGYREGTTEFYELHQIPTKAKAEMWE